MAYPKRLSALAISATLTWAAGCSHGPSAAPESSTSSPTTASEQIAQGAKLYAQHCSECHGESGQGLKGPPVVGAQALPKAPPPTAKKRTTEFRTALDVGQWVMANMPANAPGSLKVDEYLAILAFDLKANGVGLDQPLTVERAGEIVLHP
jgi:mono/diheme cytochrome c family protein